MVKRILALDVGDKRIGVAVSDPLGITAQGVETIYTRGMANDVARVLELARAYDTDNVVVGLPILMSGSEGLQAAKAREFAQKLTDNGLNVCFRDERLTSAIAERMLIDAGVRREDRKKVIDKLAAMYILQAHLDSGGGEDIIPGSSEREVYRLMDGYMDADNVVELVDEDGKELRFQHLMTLEYQQKQYVVLTPAEIMDDIGEDEVMVLRIESDDAGNDVYSTIEDDDELEAVFARYLEIAENDEDDDYADDDEE